MEKLEKFAKKLAEISANYTFGEKTLDEVISEFNSDSELKIQIYEGMGKDIDIAHSISDIYDDCTIDAFITIIDNSNQFKKNNDMNKFITEEEYKEAKKIVADYEFWNHPLNVEARKQSELNQFCDELEWSNSGLMDGMSVRLCNALKRLHIKVCDLTKKQFLSVKGNGLKSWIEFCEKTGKNV